MPKFKVCLTYGLGDATAPEIIVLYRLRLIDSDRFRIPKPTRSG